MFAGPSRAHVTDRWKADSYVLGQRRRFRLNPDCPLCLDLKHRQGGCVGGEEKKGENMEHSPIVADYEQTSLKWLHKSTSLKRIPIANLDMKVVTWASLVSECFVRTCVFSRECKRCKLTVVAATAAVFFIQTFQALFVNKLFNCLTLCLCSLHFTFLSCGIARRGHTLKHPPASV